MARSGRVMSPTECFPRAKPSDLQVCRRTRFADSDCQTFQSSKFGSFHGFREQRRRVLQGEGHTPPRRDTGQTSGPLGTRVTMLSLTPGAFARVVDAPRASALARESTSCPRPFRVARRAKSPVSRGVVASARVAASFGEPRARPALDRAEPLAPPPFRAPAPAPRLAARPPAPARGLRRR